MYTVLSTYQTFKNFPNTKPVDFINIPIQIGIGDGELKPKPEYARYIDVDYKPWRVEEEFRRIEQELLYPETLGKEVLRLHNKSLAEIWEQKRDSVYWSRNLDGDSYQFKNIDADGDEYIESCGHFVERAGVHERNNTIFNTRCKYLRDYKTGRGNYENLGNYEYNNDEAKAQFLEEVEQKGLARKAERKKSTVEIEPLDPTNQKDMVEPNNYFYNEETGDYEILREDEV